MIQQEFCHKIKEKLTAGTLLEQEPMSRHTSFRIGGPADIFVQPATVEELWDVLCLAREEKVPFFIVGNGSNLLVSDEGFRGMILHTGGLRDISAEGDVIRPGRSAAQQCCQVSAGAWTDRNGICRRDTGNSWRRGMYECRRIRRGDEGYSRGCGSFDPGRRTFGAPGGGIGFILQAQCYF